METYKVPESREVFIMPDGTPAELCIKQEIVKEESKLKVTFFFRRLEKEQGRGEK